MASDATKMRIDSLTGIRFLAALGVFMYHAGFNNWGYVGVSLFFCLSGFVLAVNYHGAFADTLEGYWEFFVARVARIWPMHLLGLLLSLPLMWQSGKGITLPAVVSHVFLFQSLAPFGNVHAFNGVSWSLSDELFFYALFPVVCKYMLSRARSIRQLTVLVGVTVVAIYGITWFVYGFSPSHLPSFFPPAKADARVQFLLYVFPPIRFGEFLLGCIVGKLWILTKDVRLQLNSVWWLSSIAVAAGLIALLSHTVQRAPASLTMLLCLPFAGLLYFTARTRSNWISRTLGSNVLVTLGEWSFSFYVLHELVLHYLQFTPLRDHRLVLTIAALAVSTLAAATCYRWVESSSRKYLRRFLSRQLSNVRQAGPRVS